MLRNNDDLFHAFEYLGKANDANYNYTTDKPGGILTLDWTGNGSPLFAFPAVVQGFTAGTGQIIAHIPNLELPAYITHESISTPNLNALGYAARKDNGWFNFAGGIFFKALTGQYNTTDEEDIWKIMIAATDTNLLNTEHYHKFVKKWIEKKVPEALAAQKALKDHKGFPSLWWDGSIPNPSPSASQVNNVSNKSPIVPSVVENNFLVLGDVTFTVHSGELDKTPWLDLVLAAYNHITTLPEYDTWISATELHDRITLANEIKEGNEGAKGSLLDLIQVESLQYPTCMTCHQKRLE